MSLRINDELDAEELFHCALEASNLKYHERAIELLKRSISLEDHPAKRLFLAAEHAEIKLYDRAIEGMQTTISLAPELWIAHFQLGQLYLVTQEISEAKKVWSHLVNSTNSPSYFQEFARGLLAIADGNTEEGIELLRGGIAENSENPALNKDIEKIIEATANQGSPQEKPQIKNNENSAVNKMLLSKYSQN
ncbi:hypothetical protein [Microbulbifer sp. GL-2]|uniref:hypothetical protein n=1 Tax=Microbulbifer sp. GL-2 TaxID=2591606 RepID=UPI001162988D|nr:hypothetical protein [Microbulbifer sp. GL-2]BBM00365.1 hypothetical protein GL2_04390 [Microbulbifer sp. GL-2]